MKKLNFGIENLTSKNNNIIMKYRFYIVFKEC